VPAASIPAFTREAEHMLRASGQLDWAVITLLALVV
jgi:hypothetical protein